MTIEQARNIELFAEYGEVQVREEYSGRGMMGSTCAAVVCDQSTLYTAIAACMKGGDEVERSMMGDMLENLSSDSMGMQRVYY